MSTYDFLRLVMLAELDLYINGHRYLHPHDNLPYPLTLSKPHDTFGVDNPSAAAYFAQQTKAQRHS
jgi:hypothetical protein